MVYINAILYSRSEAIGRLYKKDNQLLFQKCSNYDKARRTTTMIDTERNEFSWYEEERIGDSRIFFNR